MFRGTFALLHQALRTDSRKLSTHLFMLLFISSILLFLYFTEESSRYRSAPGLDFFYAISYLNLGAIILAGLGFSAQRSRRRKKTEHSDY
ncbi:MAG: hypothetical protein R3C11_26705 [Planctomycetaceae bacterium]